MVKYILMLYWKIYLYRSCTEFCVCHNIILWQFSYWFHLGGDSTKIRWTGKKKDKKSWKLSQSSRTDHSWFGVGTNNMLVISSREISNKSSTKTKTDGLEWNFHTKTSPIIFQGKPKKHDTIPYITATKSVITRWSQARVIATWLTQMLVTWYSGHLSQY